MSDTVSPGIGIAGKDILVEHQTEMTPISDLNFGLCKFSVASTEDYNPDDHKRKHVRHDGLLFNQKGEGVELFLIQGVLRLPLSLV